MRILLKGLLKARCATSARLSPAQAGIAAAGGRRQRGGSSLSSAAAAAEAHRAHAAGSRQHRSLTKGFARLEVCSTEEAGQTGGLSGSRASAAAAPGPVAAPLCPSPLTGRAGVVLDSGQGLNCLDHIQALQRCGAVKEGRRAVLGGRSRNRAEHVGSGSTAQQAVHAVQQYPSPPPRAPRPGAWHPAPASATW